MIGPRVGVKTGPMVGVRVGVGADDLAPQSTWTRDATSLIGVPLNAMEWASALSTAGISSGGPSFIWLLQDAASPAAEALGTGVTLAAGGAAGTFNAAQAGWSRVGWSATDALAGHLSSSSVLLPDAATTSSLMIAYIALLSAPSAEHAFYAPTGTVGGAGVRTSANTTSKIVIRDGANAATATNALNTSVHPLTVRYNVTGSTCTAFGDVEKLTSTFTAITGKGVAIGQTGVASANFWCGYAVLFTGAAAELTDAQIKTLLQTLGWTITWV